MTDDTVDRIANILAGEREADDALREVVAALVEAEGIGWAGIAFLEGGELVLGPSTGDPSIAPEASVPIAYDAELVGELRVRGPADLGLLERVAALVSPYVLIGWDTGGEAWEP